MRIVLNIKIFFLTIVVVLSASAFGHAEIAKSTSAIKASALQEVRFTHLTSKNGLSSDEAMSVVQDNRGFIWISTREGLNRYDGYNFKVYKNDPENPNSLSGNALRELTIDRNGFIWIATWDKGLNKFDPVTEQFTRYQHDPNNADSLSHDSVTEVYVDRQDVVWVGTLNGGLNKLNPETGQFTHYRHDVDEPNSLSDNGVFAIYEDRAGVLWVGTQNGGLNKYNRETEQFTAYKHDPNDPHSLSSNWIKQIHEDREGVLWISTYGGGLNQFDPETGKFIRYMHNPDDPHSLSDNTLRPIYEDRTGRLWIGTFGGGLNRFDRETKKFVHYRQNSANPNDLSNNTVLTIFEDQVGNLWMTTLGGVNIIERQRKLFYHYHSVPSDQNSLSGKHVSSICEDQTGALWLGTFSSGLNKFERKSGKFTRYYFEPNNPYSLSSNSIRAIFEDRQGILWISTRRGLNKYNPKTNRFTHYFHDPEKPRSLKANHVSNVIEDRQGILWLGTIGGGLNKLDRNTEQFTHYLHNPDDPQSLSNNSLWVTYEDREGGLWIGTWGGGLNKFDRKTDKFTRYQHDPDDSHSLSHNTVYSIYEDRRGILWIGTLDGGLNKFDRDNGQFTHYTEKDGLPSNAIWGIMEDRQGNLWLSTSQGLSKFNPQTETFRNYDAGDGIQGNQFSPLSHYMSSSGEMFFGGTNGVTAFYPDDIRDNPHIPPIVITDFKVNNKPVEISSDSLLEQSIEYTDTLTLSYKSRAISFEFAALNYTSSQKNQYKYRLEGFDEDWIETSSDMRFVTYTNLEPGDYAFRVIGSNNDEIWNEKGRSIKIIMTPPWWKTLWFRGFVVVLIAASLFGAFRLRTRSLKARSRELENKVAIRTKELSTSHLFLTVANRHTKLTSLLREFVSEIKQLTGCEAVAIRILDEKGNIPYEAYEGFSQEFYESESPLSIQTDQCICINVVMGNADSSLSFYTETGSFYMNATSRFLATGSEKEKGSTRNMCNRAGYESVGLIPIHTGESIIGLIHVADPRENMVPLDKVALLEKIALQLGIAIKRVLAEEELVKTLEDLEGRVEKRTAQLSDLVDKLREAEVRYRTVADFTYDWEYWQNLDGNLTYISPSCMRITGYSVEEFTDNPKLLDNIIVPEDRTIWSDHRQEAFEETKPSEVQFRIHRKDGEICWIEHVCQPVTGNNDQFLGFRASNRDVTARKEIENALERSRHDFQLLAGRLLTAQEAERRRLARELHDDLTQRLAVIAIELGKLEMQPDSIPESSRNKLIDLKNEMMTLSGDIHAISRQLHPSILDDLGLVDAIRSECNNFSRREEIEVKLHLDEIPETITDNVALCIFRVVQEGLRNISKHARAKEAHIRLACHDKEVYISIDDNGTGFDPEAVTKKPGLGLASMEERIRLIQGRFSINSRLGKGTTINIKAPLSGSHP